MLRMFHAMKRRKDHPLLPQSDSASDELEFVHRGYETALKQDLEMVWIAKERLTSHA